MKHISHYLAAAMLEMYEERAAILQFEGGLPKEKAEALARAEAETYRAHLEAQEKAKAAS